MFGRLGWPEILIIVILVMVLFGHNKIPTMMKNVANGLKTFKKEMKSDEDAPAKSSATKGAKTATARAATKKAGARKKSAATAKKSGTDAAYVEFGTYATVAAAQKAGRKLIADNPELFDGMDFVVVEDAAKPSRVALRLAFDVADDAIAFRSTAVAGGVKCKIIEI